MALVVLSVVEQRLDAVRAVLDGAEVVEIAARLGVHQSTLHRWVARYLTGQLAGLADRSHRPYSCPRQVAEAVEVAVAEMRREHPRWGSRRIRLEMLRKPGPWVSGGLARDSVPPGNLGDRRTRHDFHHCVIAVSPPATRAQQNGGPVEFDRVVPPSGKCRWPGGSSGSAPPGPGR